jgi:2-phosphoglycerate kinase
MFQFEVHSRTGKTVIKTLSSILYVLDYYFHEAKVVHCEAASPENIDENINKIMDIIRFTLLGFIQFWVMFNILQNDKQERQN